MRQFDSKIFPVIHSASDQIIHEQNERIQELQKRESIAKDEIRRLQDQISKL